MFIFAKSVKELLVTNGVLISCGLFVAQAIRWAYWGRWNLVPALLAFVMAVAVVRGMKVGYQLTRYIWRGVAVLSVLGSINPFAFMEVDAARGSVLYLIGVCLLISLSAFCLSYCLSEHAKLRRLEGAQGWRSFP